MMSNPSSWSIECLIPSFPVSFSTQLKPHTHPRVIPWALWSLRGIYFQTTHVNIMCSDPNTLPPTFVCLLPLGPFFSLVWTPVFMGVCAPSHVWFFATLWTVDHQAPLSVGFPRQEYWSRLPFHLQGIFPTQGPNLGLLHLLIWLLFTTELPGKPPVFLDRLISHSPPVHCLTEPYAHVLNSLDFENPLFLSGHAPTLEFPRYPC